MMLKQSGINSKAVFAFLSISLLLCTGIALGSTVDVYVDHGGSPAGWANISIDGSPVGQTNEKGLLYNIFIGPGPHTVVANWQGIIGSRSFTAQSDSYTQLQIDL
jgi:hypothetical protein